MADFLRYGANEKRINFEQFASKLNSDEVKNNIALQKLFSLFDIDKNGSIDVENTQGLNEAASLFNALKKCILFQ